ncbi:MAG TPA: phospholipase D-like domain-containing protein [Steroidobacteraceae bacterium]|jgi:cardiolipin synthase|nr:phospholipase D-like domain-containing protein [Steroidobacteraceae bacterium]
MHLLPFLPVATTSEWLLTAAYVCVSAAAAVHALLTKTDPRSAFGWIVVCWLFPLAGAILYALFGVNRVRTRARQLRAGVITHPPPIERALPADGFAAQLTHIGDAVTRRARLAGNDVVMLENGENAFPAMLAAIEQARESVWLASYIFDTDAVGRQFITALAGARARGVQVHVLVDGMGEWYSWPHAVRLLRAAKVRAERFLPPRLALPVLSLNLRNHRKLLIVDGSTGFVGGMNIGGREVGKPNHRRMADLHFQLHGPVVTQLAESFTADWRFAAGEALAVPPPAAPRGQCTCRVITEGPDEDMDKLLFVMLGAISVAHRQVLIMTPYFIPPPELTAALQAAALRGVEVCLVLPERSNLRYVDWACQRWLPPLTQRGVQVFLQPSPFSHTKLLVVDGAYAQIGSANLDPRSLRLNFEIAVEVYDATVCARLAEYILSARAHSAQPPVEPRGIARLGRRLRDSVFWLLSPYL